METQEKYKSQIDELMEEIKGCRMGVKSKESIEHRLRGLKSHIKSNTPFVLKSFDEAMEKTVTEAKQSISGYIENKIRSTGIESLRGELNVKLEEDNGND